MCWRLILGPYVLWREYLDKTPNCHLISRENSNSRESTGPQAFLQRQGLFMWGKVLRGGGAGSPPHMLGGAVVSNKSKKQTKAWHWIRGPLYSAAAPANATQAPVVFFFAFTVQGNMTVVDISTHLLCCTVAVSLFGWWMCMSLITSICLLTKRLR